MSIAVEKLKTAIAELTPGERAELAHFLINSIDPDEDENTEVAWDHELARRAEDIQSGQARGKPAEVVFAELREKYS